MENLLIRTSDLTSLKPLKEYDNRYIQCNLPPLLLSPELVKDMVQLHNPDKYEDNMNLMIIALLVEAIAYRKQKNMPESLKAEVENLLHDLKQLENKFQID